MQAIKNDNGVMMSGTTSFQRVSKQALLDNNLQAALGKARSGFQAKRSSAISQLDNFAEIKQHAKIIKRHTLAHLDKYLLEFEQNVNKAGGMVHYATDAKEACDIVINLCQQVDARKVTKGKSMAGEEIDINTALAEAGMERIETDLGEYIIQLANEPPSHIIAPAVHKTREQISDLFHQHHRAHGKHKRLTEVPDLVNEAREILREAFLSADVGITGANFLVAETGSSIIVTNEGNGDLTQSLPKMHIVTAGIEKIVPTLDDATIMLRLLGRSATGQAMSAYTTVSTGCKRDNDLDGPESYHVVLIDNGRTNMLSTEYEEMLHCIRCGACMNHCPVYQSVGGHAYGWVYVGPMGAVLTPLLQGMDKAKDLPHACTLNGRCSEVCPMSIPLPNMLRSLRTQTFDRGSSSNSLKLAFGLWAFLATRPRLYRITTSLGKQIYNFLARYQSVFKYIPVLRVWASSRILPQTQGKTFMAQWSSQSD